MKTTLGRNVAVDNLEKISGAVWELTRAIRKACECWLTFVALDPKRKRLDPAKVLATPDQTLRASGLSRAKIAAIKDLAAKTMDGTVPSGRALLKMSDDEIITSLTQVRGIGRWTVEMLLLFDLGRPDVWPVDDY